MPSFNLVDRAWLPCVTPDGAGVELSLRDALLRAHEQRELFDPSPLVTVALHRLLLAVLHRAYRGPEGIEEWSEIWQEGRFDPEVINGYLDGWQRRFDLFDVDWPFFQVPFIAGEKLSPVWRLAQEATSGNNVTLFDHRINDSPTPMSAAQAARYVVAAQALAVAGGVSKPFNFSSGPITLGFTLLVVGDSLFETLTLNLQPYNEQAPLPWAAKGDFPAWERREDRNPSDRGTAPDGYLDYLTWQSRQICLVPEADLSVARCQVRQRLKLPADPPHDPFKSYLVNKKTGASAQRFRAGRALWRESTALLAQIGTTPAGHFFERPEIVEWLAQINEERLSGAIEAKPQYRLAALGLTSEGSAGRIILWRREDLPLPLALLSLPDAIGALTRALNAAEGTGRILNSSAHQLAELLMAPMSDEMDARERDSDQVTKLAEALAIEDRYWPRLEEPFARFLTDLPNDAQPHPDDPNELRYGTTALPAWEKAVRDAAEKAFDETTASLDRSARSLKAVAAVRGRFRGGLNKVLEGLEKSAAQGEKKEKAA